MSRPSVQAVVVNFNAGDWLARCVGALLESDPTPAITVYDNASSDGSLAGLDRFDDRVTRVEGGRNIGFGAACNRVLGNSTADAFLVVNPDCIVSPDCLSQMLACLESQADAGIVGALIQDPEGGEQRACRRRRPTPGRSLVTFLGLESADREGVNILGPLPETAQPIDAVSGALILIRARCFRELGGFDPDYFLHCEDLDLFERARARGWRVWFEPRATAIHGKGVSQRSRPLRSEWHKHRGMVRYFRRHLARTVNPAWRWLWPPVIWARFALMLPWWGLKGWLRR